MRPWKRKRRPEPEPIHPGQVQLRQAQKHPFSLLDGYVPLDRPEFALYRTIREAVPVVDAAILKLIRLSGGVAVRCEDAGAEEALGEFLRSVPAGWNQRGIQAFLDNYLDSLLTCGRAVGEIVPTKDGREIAAVLCGDVSGVEAREDGSPLDIVLAVKLPGGERRELPRQDLLLFTAHNASPENPYGVSLLHSMPFLSDILLKIYQTLGNNWERAGNVRFAVTYKPGEEELASGRIQERSRELAKRWGEAMQSSRAGSVRDFVAVGDVAVKVIGAESTIPDCQAPVRLLIEQLISQTGIPPFLLGLTWSSTERMSSQQADIMTSELTALRRTLTPVVERVCRLWLRMHGYDCPFQVDWEEINLQDQVEEAKAELYRQQAQKLEQGEAEPLWEDNEDQEDQEKEEL